MTASDFYCHLIDKMIDNELDNDTYHLRSPLGTCACGSPPEPAPAPQMALVVPKLVMTEKRRRCEGKITNWASPNNCKVC